MRAIVKYLYSGRVKTYSGTPDEVQAQLREVFPELLNDLSPVDPGEGRQIVTIQDDVARLNQQQALSAELE